MPDLSRQVGCLRRDLGLGWQNASLSWLPEGRQQVLVSVMTPLRRQARRLAHNTALLLPDIAEIITVNDDFTDHLSDVRHWARTRRPLALAVQEGKRTDYRDLLGPRWGVRQRQQDDSTRGVAVVWDRDQAERAGHAQHTPRQIGGGYRPLVAPRRGDDMLTRGVVWQDLELLDGGILRVASTHRPPQRHNHLWRTFDAQLEDWLAASPVPVVLGLDNNQVGGPDLDDEHWAWRGVGIDGFTSDLPIRSVYELAKRNSDHRAVSAAVDVKRLPR